MISEEAVVSERPVVQGAATAVGEALGVGDVERLRRSIARLARLLRTQDEGGFGATATSALATVQHHGPLSLGDLAGREQVAPPTMTKVVEKLEAHGLVKREIDARDRRVARLTITAAGRRHLDRTRERRTAWLVGRLDALEAAERQRLADAIGSLEQLAGLVGER